MSQSDLGELLGVSNESDESEMGVHKILKLADIFKIDMRDLVLTDLSRGERKYKEPEVPYAEQDEGNVLEELNNEMRKRLVIYEQKIKELDPDLAKKWGIE